MKYLSDLYSALGEKSLQWSFSAEDLLLRLSVLIPDKVKGRLEQADAHFRRNAMRYVVVLLAYQIFFHYFEFTLNLSYSMPESLYLIQKGVQPNKGDYVAFAYQRDFIFVRGAPMLKRVEGVQGDVITSGAHKYYVNGKFVGEALERTTQGLPLEESNFNRTIPRGFYYVKGEHVRSFDSRYKAVGLVYEDMVIGRAFKVF